MRVEKLRIEIAHIMTGGGCNAEHWPEALDRADEIIDLMYRYFEDDNIDRLESGLEE